MAMGASARARKGAKVSRLEHLKGGPHHRQVQMAVDPGAAMSRNVLDYRRHAAGQQTVKRRAAEHGHLRGPGPKARSPITAWVSGNRRSRHGAQSASKPRANQFVGDQAWFSLTASAALADRAHRGRRSLGRAALPRQGGFSRCTRPPS